MSKWQQARQILSNAVLASLVKRRYDGKMFNQPGAQATGCAAPSLALRAGKMIHGLRYDMRGRHAIIAGALLALLLANQVHAVITAKTPLKAIAGSSKYIL